MKVVKVADNIFKLGYNLENEELFEGIWPTPYGVSINSYLLKGDKIALIDFIDNAHFDEFEEELNQHELSLSKIDYIILNHMEPDHTGFLNKLVLINKDIKIYCSQKSVALLNHFYQITENINVVKDGETLNLGNNLTLQFFETPNIHWPETIMTYELNNKILFSCDAFGSFGSLNEDKQFDDDLSEGETAFYKKEALRYFSNIISTFSSFVLKGIEKLSSIDIKIIAPSHGIIWRSNPAEIINTYKEYSNYMTNPTNHVTVIWSSMYGNTASMLETVISVLEEKKVDYSIFKIPRDHSSFVLADCWKSKNLIIGMPTYEYKMFPPMAALLDLMDRSHIKNRRVFRFGSFGWSGGAQKQFEELTSKLNWEYLESVEFQGCPKEEHKQKAREQILKLLEN